MSIDRRKFMTSGLLSSTAISLGCAASKAESSNETKTASPLFSFGLVADIQYADRDDIPKYDMYYRAVPDKLSLVAEHFNRESLAFVAQLGDFIDCNYESFDVVFEQWNKIKAKKIMVLGNHDFLDGNVAPEKIISKLGLKNRYYDFSSNGWNFVVLDSCDVGVYSNPAGSEKRIEAQKMLDELKAKGAANGYIWNSAIGQHQIKWLDAKIAAAGKRGEKVIIFMHHPLVPNTVWNWDQVTAVIEKHKNVVAVMAGHEHTAHYQKKAGIYHWVLSGLVTNPEQIDYAIADVYDNEIVIRGYGCNFSPKFKI